MIVHFVWQGAIKFSSNTEHYAGSSRFPSQISILHRTQNNGRNPVGHDMLNLHIKIKNDGGKHGSVVRPALFRH